MGIFFKKSRYDSFDGRSLVFRRLDISSPSSTLLPAVGPYASNGAVYARNQSDLLVTSGVVLPARIPSTPQQYNILTFSGASAKMTSLNYGIFIWANKIILDSATLYNFNADGQDGADATLTGVPFATGGSGGAGGSGGGGGAATTFKGANGGAGGANGGNGSPGAVSFSGVGGVAAGAGGSGYGFQWSSAYAWGNGGNGSDGGVSGGLHSNGGAGYGGAGGGGGATAGNGAGGGGAGGGGLICLIANECMNAGRISAQGNIFGSSFAGTGGSGGGAGGGVVWCAFKKYDGQLLANTSGGIDGAASLYEITSAGTLVLHSFWTDTWNNL